MKLKWMFVASTAILLNQCVLGPADDDLPLGFTSLARVDGSIELDIRYAGSKNFVGEPIDGYGRSACILTIPTAEALAGVQRAANELGYSLKVYDCYRPQRAVDHFIAWAADPADERMKAGFYPDVPKDELFSRGYIAERSGHSRGSTVDLTLVRIGSSQPLVESRENSYDCRGSQDERYPDNSIDMGTSFDCFDVLSHTDNPDVGEEVLANRHLLRDLMEAAGFRNYDREWWHYTYQEELYPTQHFNFPIR